MSFFFSLVSAVVSSHTLNSSKKNDVNLSGVLFSLSLARETKKKRESTRARAVFRLSEMIMMLEREKESRRCGYGSWTWISDRVDKRSLICSPISDARLSWKGMSSCYLRDMSREKINENKFFNSHARRSSSRFGSERRPFFAFD